MRQIPYYAKGLLRQLLPYSIASQRRTALLRKASRYGQEIDQRAEYYNGLSGSFDASDAPRISEISKKRSRYYLDLDESTRGFGPERRLNYLFGDIRTVPDVPTIVKSRPIGAGNENSVLLKLDRLRHFRWNPDPIPFHDKKSAAVWRGTPLNDQRRAFVKTFYHHETFDIGHSSRDVDDLPPKAPLTHAEQKQFKFFVSLEGHDVATNLKWGMASNMLVMAPQPRFETWFMEGRLTAGTHFVLLRDDLSDLEDKVDYYTRNTKEADEIIRNAHAWIDHFTDPLKERIIAVRVLEKYFRQSGQI